MGTGTACIVLMSSVHGAGVQYSLLVNPEGMYYDNLRLGGDHHVQVASGRFFNFSVRCSDVGDVMVAECGGDVFLS